MMNGPAAGWGAVSERGSEAPPISSMSALSEASTPAQDAAAPSLDAHRLQHAHLTGDLQGQGILHNQPPPPSVSDSGRKRERPAAISPVRPLSGHLVAKPPSVRRACTACHSGKTRCSEVLPCQVISRI